MSLVLSCELGNQSQHRHRPQKKNSLVHRNYRTALKSLHYRSVVCHICSEDLDPGFVVVGMWETQTTSKTHLIIFFLSTRIGESWKPYMEHLSRKLSQVLHHEWFRVLCVYKRFRMVAKRNKEISLLVISRTSDVVGGFIHELRELSLECVFKPSLRLKQKSRTGSDHEKAKLALV